jgi:disulfide bond formation protein DsbB
MQKIVKYAIAINLILALAFVYSNFSLWSFVNAESPFLVASHWSPLGIVAPHYLYTDGSISQIQTPFLAFNYPFWIFWITLAMNLFFIVKFGKGRETPSP